MGTIKTSNVTHIRKGKPGRLKRFLDWGGISLTSKMETYKNEERFLSTMFLASKTLEEVEEKGIRKMIVFTNVGDNWVWEYSGIDKPNEILEALGVLYNDAMSDVYGGKNA